MDSFSIMMAALIAWGYLTALIVSLRYIQYEYREKIITRGQVRLYYGCLHAFILTMLAAVVVDNMGILWVAIEGTTLATTLLIAFYKKDASIEAAWKYLIVCSIGISLGLLGILMLNYAMVSSVGLSPWEALSLKELSSHAAELPRDVVRWAFIFIFVGMGTKVGLFPMHTWLPDAHGKAPSPISALLSGVLLNVALYAILRFKTIVDLSLNDTAWTGNFFTVFGAFSVIGPAFILLQQRNYKRMLAYSSIEHMGLASLAIGLGPVGMIVALMHIIGHTVIKPMLFFAAGEILLHYKSTKIEFIKNLMKTLPITGTYFMIGLLLITAVPISPLFASEMRFFSKALPVHPILSLALLGSLTLVMVGMFRSALAMGYSFDQEAPRTVHRKEHREKFNSTHAVMTVQIAVALALGILFLTSTGENWLTAIAQTITLIPPTS